MPNSSAVIVCRDCLLSLLSGYEIVVDALVKAAGSSGRRAYLRSAAVLAIAVLLLLLSAPRIASAQGGADQTMARLLRGYHRATHNALLWEITPNFKGAVRGVPFRTNQWGMFDKEYSLAHPPGTYRIAFLGTSITVGAGVPQEQTMEALLEAQLNRDGAGTRARKYEILNFSAGAYGVLQNVLVTEQKVFAFHPDAVFVGVFSVEIGRMRSYLMKLVKSGYRFPDAYVQNKLLQAGVDSTMLDPELIRRLGPISEDLVRWSYQRIAEICRQRNVPVVGIVLPEPQARYGRDIDTSARLAAAAGLPLIDLRGVYDGLDAGSLRIGLTDPHWNVAGNRLIFERIYQLLRKQDAELLKLGFSSRH